MDDSRTEAEVVSRWLAEMRRRWLPVVLAGLAAVVAVVAGFAAVRSGEKSPAPPNPPVTTELPEVEPVTDDDPTDRMALFSISDGRVSAYEIARCTASGESTIALVGESDGGLTISIDATDMVGEIVVNGVFKGRVDRVVIAASGEVTVSGIVPIGETSEGAQSFELGGFACDG